MNVPAEVFVWIGGGIMAMLSINAHLLVRIMSKQSDIVLEQALQKQTISYLKRTVERFEDIPVGRRSSDVHADSLS